MSRADVEAHQRKHGFSIPEGCDSGRVEKTPATAEALPKKRRKMTVPECEFGIMLGAKKQNGEIVGFRYEGFRLAWGEDPKTREVMWYKPDFVVFIKRTCDAWPTCSTCEGENCEIKCVEVKGPWINPRDMVRFKGARAAWPQFQFELWQRDKDGRWTRLQ